MNTKTKTILGISVFAVFLAAAYFAYANLAKSHKPSSDIALTESVSELEEEIYPAEDFIVYDSQGNEVSFSDFSGKPVVLNFWASWCPPCKSEMPHFNEVYAEVKDDVVFMMVDLVDGQRETQTSGQQYIEEQGYDFPVYFDTEQFAADAYMISSIPTTILIDSDGNIVTGYQGAIDKDTLVAAIDLIKE